MGISVGGAAALKRWCVVPDGWDDCWKAAKANSGSAPAWLTVIGDSVSAGAVSSDYVNKSWTAVLKGKLAPPYRLYGDFWPTSMSASFATFGGTPPWVMNDTPTWYRWGMGALPLYSGAPANPVMTFTTPYACTDLDLVYLDYAAGTWTYTVDGGAAQTVTTTGAGYAKRVQATGLANTTHTVAVTGQSASYVALLQGIATYGSRSAGIGFGRIAYSGALAVDDAASNAVPSDMCQQWQGYGATTTGFGFPTQPSLAIVELGINDCANAGSHAGGCGPTQYRRVLTRLVQAFRRGVPNCSVLILGASNPDGVSSDVTSGLFGNPHSWNLYLAAMKDVGATYGCAFVDIHAKWGETGVAQGFQAANQPHPTDAGQADIAAVLAEIV